MRELAVVEVEVGCEARFFARTGFVHEGALVFGAVDQAALFVFAEGWSGFWIISSREYVLVVGRRVGRIVRCE